MRRPIKGTDKMTRTTTYAIALALIADVIMIAAAGMAGPRRADAETVPLFYPSGVETPVRAGKGDRLDARRQIRQIAGVTVVLRDLGATFR